MILCPACGGENPPQVSWCTHCGAKMDLTKEELDAFLSTSIKKERETHTEKRMRALLGFAVFMFVMCFAAFILTRTPTRARTDVNYPTSDQSVTPAAEGEVGFGRDPYSSHRVEKDVIVLPREEMYAEPPMLLPED